MMEKEKEVEKMAYTILLVDDEPALQQLVKEILLQQDYQVETAGNCATAINKFAHSSPDAV